MRQLASFCQKPVLSEYCGLGIEPLGDAGVRIEFEIDDKGLYLVVTLSASGQNDHRIELKNIRNHRLFRSLRGRDTIVRRTAVFFDEGEPGGPVYVIARLGKRLLRAEVPIQRDVMDNFLTFDRLLKQCA